MKLSSTARTSATRNDTYVRAGEKLTIDDLLHLMLMASDNAAARALARMSPLGPKGFIDRMNGRPRTSGSTRRTTRIRRACCRTTCRRPTTWRGSSPTLGRRAHRVDHAHAVLHCADQPARDQRSTARTSCVAGDVDVLRRKTGFISKSGYCLATLLRLPQTGQEVAVVVLGARSNAGRFMETQNLFNWLAKASEFNLLPAVAAQPQN